MFSFDSSTSKRIVGNEQMLATPPPSGTSMASKIDRQRCSPSSSSWPRSIASLIVCVVIGVALLTAYIVFEQMLLQGQWSEPLISLQTIRGVHDGTIVPEQPHDDRPRTPRFRVVLMVWDGLGYESAVTHPRLSSLLSSPTFRRDAALFRIAAQVPSVSVPNWISLLTGASPSLHGRVGNDDLGAVPFTSLLRVASDHGLSAAISGDAAWSALFAHELDGVCGADLTLSAHEHRFGDEPLRRGESYEKRDAAWGEIMLNAIANGTVSTTTNNASSSSCGHGGAKDGRIEPDLFVAYFEDIDAKGHAFGSESIEYEHAITNKTSILERTIDVLRRRRATSARDDDSGDATIPTILFVTADHGHVAVGGHGGAAAPLMHVPLLLYWPDDRAAPVDESAQPESGGRVRLQSNRRERLVDEQQQQRMDGSVVDVAASISVLLGTRLPPHSEGVPLRGVLNWVSARGEWAPQLDERCRLDMQTVLQRTRLTRAIVGDAQGGCATSFSARIERELDAIEREAKEARSDSCSATLALDRAVRLHDDAMATIRRARVGRNMAVSWTIAAVLAVTSVWSAWVACDAARECVASRDDASCHVVGAPNDDDDDDDDDDVSAAAPARACTCALVSLVVSVGAALIVFTHVFPRVYRWHPLWRWDFTLFNSPLDAYVYVAFAAVPGFACSVAMQLALATVTSARFASVASCGERWCRRPLDAARRHVGRGRADGLVAALARRAKHRQSPPPTQPALCSPVAVELSATRHAATSSSPALVEPLLLQLEADDADDCVDDGDEQQQLECERVQQQPRNHRLQLAHTRVWLCTWTLLLTIALLAGQAYHCAWLPTVLRAQIVTEFDWTMRFRSLTLAFMLLPMLVVHGMGVVAAIWHLSAC